MRQGAAADGGSADARLMPTARGGEAGDWPPDAPTGTQWQSTTGINYGRASHRLDAAMPINDRRFQIESASTVVSLPARLFRE